MIGLLIEPVKLDLILRFRISMLIQNTMDFLFETIVDASLKETSIDAMLRCLVIDI